MFSSHTKKFLSYYKPYLGLFIVIMLCALVVSGITLLLPLCTRYITKTILAGDLSNALPRIFQTGALMLVLVALHTACNYFVDYRGHSMGASMESDLRAELFAHFQKLSFRFYDEQRTGQLMSRITNDLFLLAELYHHGPEDIILFWVKFLGAFFILLAINPRLTLAVFIFLPFMVAYMLLFSKKMNAALKRNKQRIGDINAQLEDNLSGIRVVKSFASEDIEQKKFAVQNRRFLESRARGYQSEALLDSGMIALTQLVLVAVVVIGAAGILRASLDLADLITFLLYIDNFLDPIRRLDHIIIQYQDGLAGFARFMEILEIEPEIQDAPGALELPRLRGRVEFREVCFRYREGQDYILKNISLDVPAGDYVALVGSSGVGKTTLCSLIPRFYDVTSGEILLDGVNIKNIQLRSLRQSIGVVQQDVYLFAGTVLENIRYGNPTAARAEIIAAAQMANAHDFIMALPNGYDTDIGQRGVKLSGGQKQRLSIARVFLKDPPVLIFDEATSALDNESEKVVQESLELLARGRTTFVIAHRLSTIRSARRILVLTDQGIDEQGTHDELMEMDGMYARLYNV